jgi:hypothetical protein
VKTFSYLPYFSLSFNVPIYTISYALQIYRGRLYGLSET